ncbi:ornithine carbamoyltransferase subunit F [Actinomadura sp. NAK00032]|uniref:ornithine carbamoyltransferase subunit F n=1 Tax=Actinomadura sp. NAK00032 TaxID=2742128 RepID=UPI00159106C5|nr:ornithine carbamoyltransferase subunit F [Actinomadura sp. NAK00032]QKW35565.1 ornithine carbamoyltransferase subunit F [Actinomadura sp. NAK00032]
MTTSLHELGLTGPLLTDLDLDGGQVRGLLSLAAGLKDGGTGGPAAAGPLRGKDIALVLDRPALRARRAVETAAAELGARTTVLSAADARKPPAATARALSRDFDGIAYAGTDHAALVRLARAATVPVWNLGTDSWRPVQAVADILTMRELDGGDLADIAYCFTGDGRAPIAASLLTTGASLGMDVRIAAPAHMRPPAGVLSRVHDLARRSGARVLITKDARDAVAGAGFVHTAAWVTTDLPFHSLLARVQALVPYRVTGQLLRATGRPDARFMHGLPAVHDAESAIGRRLYRQFGLTGAEVTEGVYRSAQSAVAQQAANRVPAVKALLLSAFEPLR